jgi:hypothetical protein
MSNWVHTYKVEGIGEGSTITGTSPGAAIAAAITEIQEKCLTDGTFEIDGYTVTATINNGTIEIKATKNSYDDSGDSGDCLPAGGDQYQVPQRDSSGNAVWDWVRAH